jgi:hypothetical protein
MTIVFIGGDICMQEKKKMNKPVAALYFGLMTVLAFMVLVGPSAATPVGVLANVSVYGSGLGNPGGQSQTGSVPYAVAGWSNQINPYSLSGPTISQNGSAFKMSNMTLSCTSGIGCGQVSIATSLTGLTNPGIFKIDLNGTTNFGSFDEATNNVAFVASDSAAYITGSWWVSAAGPGGGPLGGGGLLQLTGGAFSIPTFYTPDLAGLGSPFGVNFGLTIDGMNWGDSITLGNSFDLDVNSIQTPVPEPGSMALFAGGLIGLGLLRRKLYKRE